MKYHLKKRKETAIKGNTKSHDILHQAVTIVKQQLTSSNRYIKFSSTSKNKLYAFAIELLAKHSTILTAKRMMIFVCKLYMQKNKLN